MLRIADHLTGPNRFETDVTTLHLSPSSYLSQVNTTEYQEETFRPIGEEARDLGVSVHKLFKPSQNIEHDIIETANSGAFDLLLLGIGHSVFEGTLLGKLLGITTKIISPVRLLDSITGKESLFHADIFDEKTTHIIKSVKSPVAILIEKDLQKIGRVFIPIFSNTDHFLLRFADRILSGSDTSIIVGDSSSVISRSLDITDVIQQMTNSYPNRISVLNGQFEKNFLEQQDLMLIGLDSWKKEVEAHSAWLSNSPSVLIIRD